MKLYISKATLRTIEKFGNASLTHISATPSDHMSVELDATPLANEASKPACAHRIVDARNEIVKSGYLCVDCGAVFAGIHAPAAPSVEQDERGACELCKGVGKIGIPGQRCFACDGCGKSFEARAASTSANVAQGAVAVATVKVYETYTGQNGWTEVAQEEYDRTKDKYEHRIRRVPAPPAQTATTDDARDAALWRYLAQHAVIVDASVEGMVSFTVAKDADTGAAQDAAARAIDMLAAQSASGDTK